MKYFAYGSNMSHKQMNERCPNNIFLGLARIDNYKLVFDGYSRKWNGAVANIIESSGEMVLGGLFEISDSDLVALNRYEGFPAVYQREEFDVLPAAGEAVSAIAYFRKKEKLGQPSRKYKNIILCGARDCGLPEEYINQIGDL